MRNLLKLITVIIIFLALFYFLKNFELASIRKILIQIDNDILVDQFYKALTIFLLRFVSIIVPVIPGTYCSILAGWSYGVNNGLALIFMADFLSCSSSFFIARKLGRRFVSSLLGSKQMSKVEDISIKYLEDNFFFMTGLLMTQFFDFVCYSIGLTKVKWRKFMPALMISILISDAPFVAGGHALKGIKDVSIEEILNGEINVLRGPYLIIFLVSVIAVFALGMLSTFLQKRNKLNS